MNEISRPIDRAEILHVRSPRRDEPPLGDWCARGLLLKIEDGELYIATVFDSDARKLVRVLPGGRQKTRMLLYGRTTKDETALETVSAEVHEEAGVDEELLGLNIFYPVCMVSQEKRFRRDSNDLEIRERRIDLQHIFARWGDVELHQTDDLDAEDPRWEPLRDIIASVKVAKMTKHSYEIYRVLERGGDEKEIAIRKGGTLPAKTIKKVSEKLGKDYLCLSHIIILLSALQFIGREFKKYIKGELFDECDLTFFKEIAKEGKKSSEEFYRLADLVERLIEMDVQRVVTEIVGDSERA